MCMAILVVTIDDCCREPATDRVRHALARMDQASPRALLARSERDNSQNLDVLRVCLN